MGTFLDTMVNLIVITVLILMALGAAILAYIAFTTDGGPVSVVALGFPSLLSFIGAAKIIRDLV